MAVAALYRFLHASDESDHLYMLRTEGCKLRASSLLSLAFRRRLSAMDKADQKVWSLQIEKHLCLLGGSVSPTERR